MKLRNAQDLFTVLATGMIVGALVRGSLEPSVEVVFITAFMAIAVIISCILIFHRQ